VPENSDLLVLYIGNDYFGIFRKETYEEIICTKDRLK